MDKNISTILARKGSEIAKLFGVDSVAVESTKGFYPIFHQGDNYDSRVGDAQVMLEDGKNFVVHAWYKESEQIPGDILIAIKDGHPLGSMDRRSARWACHILGYHKLPNNILDVIIGSYNARQAQLAEH